MGFLITTKAVVDSVKYNYQLCAGGIRSEGNWLFRGYGQKKNAKHKRSFKIQYLSIKTPGDTIWRSTSGRTALCCLTHSGN
jgi:hypothetical protein